MIKYKSLAIKGAGIGIGCYIGAVLPLEQRGILAGLEKVAGTSAGAIIATLISLKYTAKEMFDIYEQIDFSKFEDGNLIDKAEIFDKYGLYRGDYFLEFIQGIISKNGLSPLATFSDFNKAECLDLYVYANSSQTDCEQEFSYKTTPDIPVCYAVRASMSIPVLFDGFKIGNVIYSDGGAVLNYPINFMDINGVNPETLGLHFGTIDEAISNNSINYGEPIKYFKSVANSALNAQTRNLARHKEDCDRTIFIPSGGINTTDFNVTEDKKRLMAQNGINAVNVYFK